MGDYLYIHTELFVGGQRHINGGQNNAHGPQHSYVCAIYQHMKMEASPTFYRMRTWMNMSLLMWQQFNLQLIWSYKGQCCIYCRQTFSSFFFFGQTSSFHSFNWWGYNYLHNRHGHVIPDHSMTHCLCFLQVK